MSNIIKNDLETIDRLYLNVAYAVKDLVRELGGKFDGKKKKWYITTSTTEENLKKILAINKYMLKPTVPKCILSDECIDNDIELKLNDKMKLEVIYNTNEVLELFKAKRQAKKEANNTTQQTMSKSQWFG
jgi:hypothetical protein